MSKRNYKPCCKKFEQLAVRYCDFVSNEDHSLKMLSELLLRATDDLPLDGRDLRSVAYQIEQYLNRKVALESWLLGRSLCLCTFDEVDIQAEIIRISHKMAKD